MSAAGVTAKGLDQLVKSLRGPAFRDVNRELRVHARTIAADVMPAAQAAVRRSGAPQAAALAATARVHSDRVPVFAFGKVNPRFGSGFKGEDRKRRRGSLAHGVVYGPLGGRRATRIAENYYRIRRDPSGGALGDSLRESGQVYRAAVEVYLRVYLGVLRAHGFTVSKGGAR